MNHGWAPPACAVGCPWAGKLVRPVGHMPPWSSLKYPNILSTTQCLGSDRTTRKVPSPHSTTCPLVVSGHSFGLGNRFAMLFGLNISHKPSTESTPVSLGWTQRMSARDSEDCTRIEAPHSHPEAISTIRDTALNAPAHEPLWLREAGQASLA